MANKPTIVVLGKLGFKENSEVGGKMILNDYFIISKFRGLRENYVSILLVRGPRYTGYLDRGSIRREGKYRNYRKQERYKRNRYS